MRKSAIQKNNTPAGSNTEVTESRPASKNHKRLIISSIISALAAIVFGVGAIMAWIAYNTPVSETVIVENFEITPKTGNTNATWTAAGGNPVQFNLDNTDNLKVSLQSSGNHGDAYIRVKVFESYYDGTSASSNLLPSSMIDEIVYSLGTNWVKGTDGYYYYTNVVKRSDQVIPFIIGVSSITLSNGVLESARGQIYCRLSIIVEAVQPDRAGAFGFDTTLLS